MIHVNHERFHGNRSARFSKIRKTDTQTDRQTRQLYIHRCVFRHDKMVLVENFDKRTVYGSIFGIELITFVLSNVSMMNAVFMHRVNLFQVGVRIVQSNCIKESENCGHALFDGKKP